MKYLCAALAWFPHLPLPSVRPPHKRVRGLSCKIAKSHTTLCEFSHRIDFTLSMYGSTLCMSYTLSCLRRMLFRILWTVLHPFSRHFVLAADVAFSLFYCVLLISAAASPVVSMAAASHNPFEASAAAWQATIDHMAGVHYAVQLGPVGVFSPLILNPIRNLKP